VEKRARLIGQESRDESQETEDCAFDLSGCRYNRLVSIDSNSAWRNCHEALENWTASEETFKEDREAIRRTAGVLAVLGQAIEEHPQGESQKISGLGLRDAALELAESKSPEETAKAIKNLQAAQEGIPNRKAGAAKWADLISMDDLMHVVNSRNAKVRRSVRRSRDPEGDSRNALTIAMLSIPMAEQAEYYLSDEAEIKEWKKYSHDYGKGMAGVAAAFKAKDKAAIQKHLQFATKACNDCHAKFRDDDNM